VQECRKQGTSQSDTKLNDYKSKKLAWGNLQGLKIKPGGWGGVGLVKQGTNKGDLPTGRFYTQLKKNGNWKEPSIYKQAVIRRGTEKQKKGGFRKEGNGIILPKRIFLCQLDQEGEGRCRESLWSRGKKNGRRRGGREGGGETDFWARYKFEVQGKVQREGHPTRGTAHSHPKMVQTPVSDRTTISAGEKGRGKKGKKGTQGMGKGRKRS